MDPISSCTNVTFLLDRNFKVGIGLGAGWLIARAVASHRMLDQGQAATAEHGMAIAQLSRCVRLCKKLPTITSSHGLRRLLHGSDIQCEKNDSSAREIVAKCSCSLARASVSQVETSCLQLWGHVIREKFILRQHSGMLLQDNVAYRSPAVVVKECGRTLGVAVQQMSRVWWLAAIDLWQPTASPSAS